ncbi:MAG TPA: hypothetical protein PL029_05890 [Bacteroidia bacterium]|nr:hypothetical protein [Bacteroidia bacterium]
MMKPSGDNSEEKPTHLFVEKDVLGLDKKPVNGSGTRARPNRIFVAIGILIVLALVYWLFNH